MRQLVPRRPLKLTQLKLNKLFKEAESVRVDSEKERIDREVNLLKLEKLIILMCFEAPSIQALLGSINDENDFSEILKLIRNRHVLESSRLNQPSLNFEVLIDLIKHTTTSLLTDKDEIYNFVKRLAEDQTQEIKVRLNYTIYYHLFIHQRY